METATEHARAMPRRVREALILLWISWGISAFAIALNQVLFHYPLTSVATSLGALALQGIIIYAIGRGSNFARVLLLIILAIALVPMLIALSEFMVPKSLLSSAMSGFGMILKTLAVLLLFTRDAPAWYAPARTVGP